MTTPGGGSDIAAAERAVMDQLFDEEGRADPAAALRSASVPGCRYAFVSQVLHDPRFVAPVMPTSPDLMFQVVARFMLRLSEPERHRRVRSRFSGLFTPRRVEAYRERVTARVHALIDELPPRGPVDLVSTFTRPLPFGVIADVLGVPRDRHPWVADRMDTFGRAIAGQRDHSTVVAGNAAVAELLDYFDSALADRRACPGDDVLSLLAGDPATGEARADLLANCILFILAGHVTTTALLSVGVQLLADHRDQLELLLADPTGWPVAVEELLRYVSPTAVTASLATADTEIDGCTVRTGDQRLIAYAGANRDPAVFTDPDDLDLQRRPNPHLAFSAGTHHCLGAPLARLHAEIALPTLFTRLPNLALTAAPEWLGSVPVRQIAALQVDWSGPRS